MGAKNKVIAGDYSGCQVTASLGTAQLMTGFMKSMMLDKSTIAAYEIITDEHRKSAASGVTRGIVGGALLGPVGMLAGAFSAKSKGTYTIAIRFKDGRSSLLEVDDKIYKNIVKNCF